MTQTVRLITSNLLHDGADANALAGLIDEHAPDVVVTQELGPRCAEVLEDRFPTHYLHPADDVTGRGVATRFEARFGDLDMPGRSGTITELVVGEEVWDLLGVHLLNPVDFPWWATARLRGRQLDAIDTWGDGLDGRRPALVVGDFNASPAWPAYRRVSESWVDLVAEYHAANGASAAATWGWRPGWPRLLRIDHVFGRGVRVLEVERVPVEGSDHAAILVDLVGALESDRREPRGRPARIG